MEESVRYNQVTRENLYSYEDVFMHILVAGVLQYEDRFNNLPAKYQEYVKVCRSLLDKNRKKIVAWTFNKTLIENNRYYGKRETIFAGENVLFLSEEFYPFPFKLIPNHEGFDTDKKIGVVFSKFLLSTGKVVTFPSQPGDNFLCRYFRTVTYEKD